MELGLCRKGEQFCWLQESLQKFRSKDLFKAPISARRVLRPRRTFDHLVSDALADVLLSHATFLRITRPPSTSVRVLPSFGSNTLTSAGSAARNSQKLATPLYLNATSRTVFAASELRACATRESRFCAGDSERDDSGYGKGAGDGAGDASAIGGAGTRTGVSYG
jgi:hypothetical protein